MISISPPQVMPYAPATQPIAFVSPMCVRDEANGRLILQFWFLDAKKNRITIDAGGVPSGIVTTEQLATFASAPGVAGDTFDQDLARRCLPIVETNYGLTGTIVATPNAPAKSAKSTK